MSREELKNLTIKELKAKCKELKLQGYSRLKEDELIDLILDAEANSDVDELLDGEESTETEDEESTETEDEESTETEDEIDEGSLVVFKKLIKGPFGFNGKTFKGSTFELTAEEAKHPKIKNAITGQLIVKK